MAFREMSFLELTRGPVKFCCAEYLRKSAFGGTLTAEDELVVGNFVDTAIDQYHAQQLTETQLMLCATIWKGTNVPGVFGWAQAEPALPAEIRPQFAYLFGHRYQGLKRIGEAESFLKYAAGKAPAESKLSEAAVKSLEKLKSKLEKNSATN
jgi:hypothetical protein